MLGIHEFFKRIQNLHSKEVFVRTVIQESLIKYTNVGLELKDINFQESTIVLKNTNQTFKSVVFTKKNQILNDINEKQTIRKVTDIR